MYLKSLAVAGEAQKKQKTVTVLLCQEPGGQATQGQAPKKMLLCYSARSPEARHKKQHINHRRWFVVSCNL